MRILIYTYELAPLGGGIGNEIKHILEEFAKNPDHKFDIITASIDNKFEQEEFSDNIQIYKIPVGKKENLNSQSSLNIIKYMGWSYLKTWQFIFRKYDGAMVFGYPGPLVSMLFRWRMPYVVALKGIDVPGHLKNFGLWYRIYTPLTKLGWIISDKILPISKGMQKSAEKTLQTEKYHIVENGISIDEFTPLPRSKKFDKFTITAGGTRLARNKGIQFLIEGFAAFHKENKNSQLLLIGDGEYREELESLSRKLEIEDAIIFKGNQPHSYIEETLPKCHVFCLPSYSEGMSNALLESLAAGLPIIFTNTGGAEELVKDDNGFIIEKESPEQIQEKLEILYSDERKWNQMSKNSRKLAESMSWKEISQKYLDVFTDLWQK